jgi:lipopolysaccharide export system protein LptC
MGVLGRIGAAVRGDNRLTSISVAGDERGIAFPAHAGGNSERLYRRALRHSRRVRLLRVLLVGAVVVVLVGLVVDNYLPSVGALRLPGEIANVLIQGTKITMQKPRLTGYTSDGRAYALSAEAAAQDVTKPDFVQLEHIRAKMEMADKSTVDLWADDGVYDMKGDMITLNNNIRLVSSTGYEARLSQAVVDVRKGNVVSKAPVWVKLLDGTLDANRLEITDKGDVVRFLGDVSMVLQSGKPDGKAGEP